LHVIKVVTLAQYLTETAVQWRNEDHCASKFVKAVKGEPFRGYATVPVCGRREHLDSSNSGKAILWAAEMAPAALQTIGVKFFPNAPPYWILPMPSSSTTTAMPRVRGRAHLVADAMAAAHPTLFQVLDLLSFRTAMQPSRKGGTRNPHDLRGAMVAQNRSVPEDNGVIIVDDVLTSGGHFQAACCVVEEAGWLAFAGFAVGRSMKNPEDDPFAVQAFTLMDPFWSPEDDFDEDPLFQDDFFDEDP
jgi:hypothetical protein